MLHVPDGSVVHGCLEAIYPQPKNVGRLEGGSYFVVGKHVSRHLLQLECLVQIGQQNNCRCMDYFGGCIYYCVHQLCIHTLL